METLTDDFPGAGRMSLAMVERGVNVKPPTVLLYGVPGIGKTTWASNAPNPIILPTEDGIGLLDVARFPLAESYSDVVEAIQTLLRQEHDYKTLVIDAVDGLEQLVWKETCFHHGKKNIEDFGYGKGYMFADELWLRLLDGLSALREKRGMSIIIIGHAEIRRFEDPVTDPYDRYTLRAHKRASAMLFDWADNVLFASYEVSTTKGGDDKRRNARGVGAGERALYCSERPAHNAKNRYGLPDKLKFEWSAFAAAVKQGIASAKGAQNENTEN